MESRVGPVAYRLQLQGRYSRVHPVFHVSLLKRHVAGGSSDAPPMPVERDGDLHFEVERIVKHKKSRRKLKFLVRFKGYDASEDQWFDED